MGTKTLPAMHLISASLGDLGMIRPNVTRMDHHPNDEGYRQIMTV